MKEHPILFSTPMVQAILKGRKTVTRRIVSSQFGECNEVQYSRVKLIYDPELCDPNKDEITPKQYYGLFCEFDEGEWCIKCPFGDIGHKLWVRETFNSYNEKLYGYPDKEVYLYKADGTDRTCTWKPSIFMPRAACRITLQITSVKVERLQDITEDQAIAEGIFYNEELKGFTSDNEGRNFHASDPHKSFMKLWIAINGEDSWDANPFVWAIGFNKL